MLRIRNCCTEEIWRNRYSEPYIEYPLGVRIYSVNSFRPGYLRSRPFSQYGRTRRRDVHRSTQNTTPSASVDTFISILAHVACYQIRKVVGQALAPHHALQNAISPSSQPSESLQIGVI